MISSRGKRVAIIDDDSSVRKSMGRLLTSVGYEVEAYASGPEFFSALMNNRVPDCLVIDVYMPVQGGFDVQSVLAECGFDIPVVVVTGHYDSAVHARAIAGGAYACIDKIAPEEVLIGAIEQASRGLVLLPEEKHASSRL